MAALEWNGWQGTPEYAAEPRTIVLLPHPFAFLLLKLFAYRDQHQNADKNYGRYHAFDIYRIVAMITETEYPEIEAQARRYNQEAQLVEARHVITELFQSDTSKGTLAVREYAETEEFNLSAEQASEFITDLSRLLDPG